MGAISDEELALVAAANEGDPHAFEALYRAHRDWVVALGYRFTGNRDDALDVLQETFAYFFGKFPGFELRASVRGFLFPVVRHQSISLARKRRKVVSLDAAKEADAGIELRFEPPLPGEFGRLIAALPTGQREVVRLRFALGLKLPEIAEALDVPVGTVKSRLHNALKTLRKEQE